MSTTALTKPGVVSDTLGSDHLDTDGSVFAMKVFEFAIDVRTVTLETTGDGDDNPPCFDHNALTYVRLVLRGAMVSGHALGMAQISTTSNPVGSAVVAGSASQKVKLHFNNSDRGTTIDFLLVERVQNAASTRGVFHGVTITGVVTGSDVEKLDTWTTI